MEGGEDHPLDQGGGLASEAGKKAEGEARRPGLAQAFSKARQIASGPSAAIPPDGRRDARLRCLCAGERRVEDWGLCVARSAPTSRLIAIERTRKVSTA